MCISVPRGPTIMKRTNVVLDEKKVKKAKAAYNIETTRELIDFALSELLRAKERQKILKLKGKVKIDLNLSQSRNAR